MQKAETVTTLYYPQSIEDICDAFGKGFDQCKRDLSNPYPLRSDQYFAYIYGRTRGKEEDERQFKEKCNAPF